MIFGLFQYLCGNFQILCLEKNLVSFGNEALKCDSGYENNFHWGVELQNKNDKENKNKRIILSLKYFMFR